jgi:protein-tyrosine phosphatase
VNSTYDLSITAEDSGTYVCEINDTVTDQPIQGEIEVIVYAPPKIVNFTVIPINTTELYINWTVKAYNSPIDSYTLLVRELPSENYNLYIKEKIAPKNTSFVIKGLNKSTAYQLKLEVKTKNWAIKGEWADKNTVKTLDKQPVFVPNISINGFSATSVTIGWPPPPEDIENLIHYYVLKARKSHGTEARKSYHFRDGRNLPYMFGNLDPHSTYIFQVSLFKVYIGR